MCFCATEIERFSRAETATESRYFKSAFTVAESANFGYAESSIETLPFNAAFNAAECANFSHAETRAETERFYKPSGAPKGTPVATCAPPCPCASLTTPTSQKGDVNKDVPESGEPNELEIGAADEARWPRGRGACRGGWGVGGGNGVPTGSKRERADSARARRRRDTVRGIGVERQRGKWRRRGAWSVEGVQQREAKGYGTYLPPSHTKPADKSAAPSYDLHPPPSSSSHATRPHAEPDIEFAGAPSTCEGILSTFRPPTTDFQHFCKHHERWPSRVWVEGAGREMPTLVEAVLEWEKNSSLGGGNKMQRNVAADERKKLISTADLRDLTLKAPMQMNSCYRRERALFAKDGALERTCWLGAEGSFAKDGAFDMAHWQT
ncbi:hypothetical protein B0H14DRAFT_2556007 [Mycena olivaceomarginata]|nr:hypothetical protein B0H14DRAFT_2556007 [Mycena olivaceomarginata]